MKNMKGARRFPTPKHLLFRLHQDLSKVAVPFSGWNKDVLTELEIFVILLEDRRFFQHIGIDIQSVVRESLKMVTFKRHGGASTIDMQFVRTQTGFKARTLRRKLYEMLLAYFLQFRMTKLAILRSYLQIVYLGSGVHGVEQAALSVFRKAPWELDRTEAAFLAAMMVYPKPSVPTAAWRAKVERRAAYGLRLFDLLGDRYKQRFE